MNFPDEFLTALSESEGVRALPYRDSEGNETIGIGHNLSKPLTRGAIDHILNDDLLDAVNKVNTALPWTENLDRVRYWSLVELCFNMGLGNADTGRGLLGFKQMLQSLQAGQYVNASLSLLNSRWAEQVGHNRSTRIAAQIRTGNWQ